MAPAEGSIQAAGLRVTREDLVVPGLSPPALIAAEHSEDLVDPPGRAVLVCELTEIVRRAQSQREGLVVDRGRPPVLGLRGAVLIDQPALCAQDPELLDLLRVADVIAAVDDLRESVIDRVNDCGGPRALVILG